MKTQIIQLDPHDDHISLRDRMGWAKTPRILLVWPRRRRVAVRPLDLKLLQRHARALGAQLGLVTRSEPVRRAANDLGIPCFETTADAQRESWPAVGERPVPKRRSPRTDLRALRAAIRPPEAAWRRHPATRTVFFSLAVLAVLSLALGFLPRAEIALAPVTEPQSVTLPVAASPDAQGVFLSGALPARTITVTVDAEVSRPVSGQAQIPAQTAVGTLRFRNLTNAAIQIPAGTVVRTLTNPAVRFVTTQAAELPPGSSGTVDVPAQALSAGVSGNLPAGALTAIEGGLGPSMTVTNPAATFGGADRPVTAPSESDRLAILQAARSALDAAAREAILAQLAEGDLFFPGGLEQIELLAQTVIPEVGQPADEISAQARAVYTGMYATATDLRTLAAGVLDVSIPAGFRAVEGTLVVEAEFSPATDADGTTRWRMIATRQLMPVIDPVAVSAGTRGRTPARASAWLAETFELSAPPVVRMRPSWWPWLPWMPLRIEVVFEPGGNAP